VDYNVYYHGAEGDDAERGVIALWWQNSSEETLYKNTDVPLTPAEFTEALGLEAHGIIFNPYDGSPTDDYLPATDLAWKTADERNPDYVATTDHAHYEHHDRDVKTAPDFHGVSATMSSWAGASKFGDTLSAGKALPGACNLPEEV